MHTQRRKLFLADEFFPCDAGQL